MGSYKAEHWSTSWGGGGGCRQVSRNVADGECVGEFGVSGSLYKQKIEKNKQKKIVKDLKSFCLCGI